MLSLIIKKELRAILLSPKFVGTFSVSTILILLSVLLGILGFRHSQANYDQSRQLTAEELAQKTSYLSAAIRESRQPDPLQIFVAGVDNDIGRRSVISQWEPVKLFGSFYSEETLFALFRYFDFAFIVQVVISLFAILFTFDSVNGEKESGTLQLTFSNNLPRSVFIIGKYVGTVLGLIIPFCLTVLLAILLLPLMQVPFGPGDWLRLGGLLLSALLSIMFFAALGICASALSRRSSVSFLIALVAWVCFVFILPRGAAMIAGQAVDVPSAAELDSRREVFEKDRWNREMTDMGNRMRQREEPTEHMSKEEAKKYRDDHEWQWMVEDDSLRKAVTKDIDNYGIRLSEDFRNRKADQERLTALLARFSPASAFQLSATTLSTTDVGLKARYEEAMTGFRTGYTDYIRKKQEQTGDAGGIKIRFDSRSGFAISTPHADTRLDFSDAPVFQHPRRTVQDIFTDILPDLGALLCAILVVFGLTFFRFLKYEFN